MANFLTKVYKLKDGNIVSTKNNISFDVQKHCSNIAAMNYYWWVVDLIFSKLLPVQDLKEQSILIFQFSENLSYEGKPS